jgi:hypothetical protein
LARIQAADSTRVADENFRGFALGEKLRSRSSIAPHTAKKQQKKIARRRQSTRIRLERATAAAFPGSPQPGCSLKLSPPVPSPLEAHNSSKLIVARVSPFKSKEGIATALRGEDVLN